MYLTEKLVLLIESQLDTPLLFPNIVATQADGSEIDSTIYSVHPVEMSDVAAGDPDVDANRAEAVGEEAVGGTTPTPDQNVIDDLADSAGITTADGHPLKTEAWLNRWDEQRFELDPDSAEDFGDRN